ILFLTIGDHYGDDAPLQIGQFESGDEEMDMWLEKIWIESGGRGNQHESYNLAWYVGAYHTSIDSFEKRNQKGFIFTIGDEKVHKNLDSNAVKKIFGSKEPVNYTTEQLLKDASKFYNI